MHLPFSFLVVVFVSVTQNNLQPRAHALTFARLFVGCCDVLGTCARVRSLRSLPGSPLVVAERSQRLCVRPSNTRCPTAVDCIGGVYLRVVVCPPLVARQLRLSGRRRVHCRPTNGDHGASYRLISCLCSFFLYVRARVVMTVVLLLIQSSNHSFRQKLLVSL